MSESATSPGRGRASDPEPATSADTARVPITRGNSARDRVLRAALELLADEGFPGFTMEAVAARARASKATVYRRWSSKAELLIAAIDLITQPQPLPATGDLRTDLVKALASLRGLLTQQPFPRLLAAFIDAAERDPALSTLHAELAERRREPLRQVLMRAREREEISPTVDIELAIDLLVGPAFYRRFLSHKPFTDSYTLATIDYVLTIVAGSKPGAPQTPTPP